MPYRVEWLVQNHVLYIEYSGDMTMKDDFIPFYSEGIKRLDNVETPQVHHIINTSQITSQPPINDIQPALKPFISHPRFGWAIVIDDMNPIAKFMITMTGKIMKFKIRFVKNLDEGIAFLQEVDLTLPENISPPHKVDRLAKP